MSEVSGCQEVRLVALQHDHGNQTLLERWIGPRDRPGAHGVKAGLAGGERNYERGFRSRLAESNVGPAQQLSHRARIEMKYDVGQVARCAAPFVAGFDAEDQT